MRVLHSRTDVVVVTVALGDCGELLAPDAALYTEWFDIDEPCKVRFEAIKRLFFISLQILAATIFSISLNFFNHNPLHYMSGVHLLISFIDCHELPGPSDLRLLIPQI